jgi:hypothetical protein
MSSGISGAEMNTNINGRIFLLLIAAVFGQLVTSTDVAAQVSQWSKEATSLSFEKGIRQIKNISPGEKKIAIIDGVKLLVMMEGKTLPGIEDAGVSTLAELLWAPDSTAFSITESYGGVVGDWHVTVYEIRDERVQRLNITADVVKSFKKHYKCKESEEPNVGAIEWLNGGKQLLLVAEVPPHSSCPRMGKLRGYIVKIPTGRIAEEFSERKLRSNWGPYLGNRLNHMSELKH